MGVVTLGPLALSADRLAAVAGIWAFLLLAGLLSRFVDPRFRRWTGEAVAIGLVAARAAYVAGHLDAYAAEPASVLFVWQGGFSAGWGLAAVAAWSLYRLRKVRLLAWAGAPTAGALAVWGALSVVAGAPGATPAGTPDIALPQLSGPPLSLADLEDRPVVLNFWATWCPPCRREMPRLTRMASEHPGVTFLFVNQGEDAATARAYLSEEALDPAHVLLDRRGALGRAFSVLGLPTTLFLGSGGEVAEAHFGEISLAALQDNIAAIEEE